MVWSVDFCLHCQKHFDIKFTFINRREWPAFRLHCSPLRLFQSSCCKYHIHKSSHFPQLKSFNLFSTVPVLMAHQLLCRKSFFVLVNAIWWFFYIMYSNFPHRRRPIPFRVNRLQAIIFKFIWFNHSVIFPQFSAEILWVCRKHRKFLFIIDSFSIYDIKFSLQNIEQLLTHRRECFIFF